jgi:hypothetical protein
MSRHRHIITTVFQPSVYSTGLQPRQSHPISGHPNRVGGYEYGDFVDYFTPWGLMGKAKDAVFGEEKEEPTTFSVVSEYWWAFVLAAPVVYLGVNYAFDRFGKSSDTVGKK